MTASPLSSRFAAAFIFASAFCLAAAAQTSISMSENGLNYPIPGKSFQAEATMRSSQHLGDGTVIGKEMHITLARDDQGRFSFVTHSIQPADNTESHIIFDPVNGRQMNWGTLSKAVMSFPLSANRHVSVTVLPPQQDAASTLPADQKSITKEDLGSKTIAGIPVVGMRTVTTIAAGTIGNSQQIAIRHDQWIAPDLQLIVAESDDNPFGATRTYEITSFERSAPPESLFQPPADLPLQERTMPPLARPTIAPPPAGTAPPPPPDLSSLFPAPDSNPAPTVPPDQQPSTAQVAKLLQLIHPQGQVQSVMKAMPFSLSDIIKQVFQAEVALDTGNRPGALTPGQEATLAVLRDKYGQKALTIFSTDDLIAEMTPIYQRHMTRADVDAYIAFYSSPAGQRLVDFQPVMEKESMPLIARRILAAQKALTDQMKKEIDACINSPAPAQK